MTIFKQLFVLKIGLLSCLLTLPAVAQNVDGVTIFGDSLSDNGNAFKATGGAIPASPPYFNGRFSNGPVWVEGFPAELKLPAAAVNNFAIGGSTSGANSTGSPTVTDRLNLFLLASPKVSPNQLFIIWAGANDYQAGILNPAQVVGNITTSVQRLIDAGGQQFIVPNLPDLGRTPTGAATPAQSAGLSQLTATHNLGLQVSIDTLVQNNPNISIVPTDMASLFRAVVTDPARFGFTNVTQPCLNPTTGAVCPNPDASLFWDTIHPTAAAHRLVSAYALDTLTAPRSIAAQAETGLGTANQQTREIDHRLLALRASSPLVARQLSVFVSGDSNFGDRSATSTNTGFNIDTKGVTVGADYPVSENIAVGVALSSAWAAIDLGAQISYPFKASFGTISPYFAANFEHEFGQNGRQVVTELVTQPGIPIRTKIGASDRDFIRLSTGVQTEFTNNLSVNLGYETIVGKDNFSDNYLNAKIRYQF